jgi:hypothetical protein
MNSSIISSNGVQYSHSLNFVKVYAESILGSGFFDKLVSNEINENEVKGGNWFYVYKSRGTHYLTYDKKKAQTDR